jgi:hypothetical protein
MGARAGVELEGEREVPARAPISISMAPVVICRIITFQP